ncbi:MAG: hypothetical protein G01um101431_1169 [Parcubacteria group bacterium Gr01-1014_31]|nr:MAG: hypothetical protein G01um101431_1169 [Parcubacteria group bacterium Gr01-1014_31]
MSMTIKQIYQLAIQLGKLSDLRGQKSVAKVLARAQARYDHTPENDRWELDPEATVNPYLDSRVLFDHGRPVRKVLAGIDITPSDLIIAKQLGCDLVIAHHPAGEGLADLHDVMHLQAEVMALYGMPINIAESLMRERITEVAHGVSASNHHRTVDAARLLDIGFACTHTCTDNQAAKFLDGVIRRANPETLGEIIAALKTVPEYREAIKRKAGPFIMVGTPESSTGKIVLTDITGGTEGAVGIYEKMSQYGFGTIIGMHMDKERKKEAAKYHINVVIAGHMSSDSLGMNLMLDQLERRGVEIIPAAGLIRVSRAKAATRTKASKPTKRRR